MGSIYKIIEIVGTSEKSWEDAARVALETAAKSVQEIRIAEVNKLDIKMEKMVGWFIEQIRYFF